MMPSVTNKPKSDVLALILLPVTRRLIKSGAVTTAMTRIKAEWSMMPPKREEGRKH